MIKLPEGACVAIKLTDEQLNVIHAALTLYSQTCYNYILMYSTECRVEDGMEVSKLIEAAQKKSQVACDLRDNLFHGHIK